MRIRTHVNSEGKIPSTGEKKSSEEDRTHDAASNRTASLTHYHRAIPTRTSAEKVFNFRLVGYYPFVSFHARNPMTCCWALDIPTPSLPPLPLEQDSCFPSAFKHCGVTLALVSLQIVEGAARATVQSYVTIAV